MKTYDGYNNNNSRKSKKSKTEKKIISAVQSRHKRKSVQKTKKDTDFFQFFEHTSDLIWIIDNHYKLLFINQAIRTITGDSPQKVLGKTISDVLFSNEHKQFKPIERAIEKTSKKSTKRFSKRIYHSIKRKNKSDLHVETVISITDKIQGKSAAILGITRINSNDTPAEEELRKSNLSLMFAQQLAHLGIYQFDADGKNNLWSNETFKIFERDVKEGTPSLEEFYNFVHPEDQSFVRNSFVNAIRNNSGFNFEHRIIISGTKLKYLHSIGQGFQNKKKSGVRISGIFMDITDRKIAEEKLGKFLFELKKSKDLLEDRAMELASLNQQLLAASNELTRTNESKDKFFSILAHDLRSPFHGLLGFSNMLLAEYDNMSNEERKHITERINQSALYVFKLIENLLEWSRLQSGRMEINTVKTDLNETVLYIFNLLNSSAVSKEVWLINKIPEGVKVFADTNMLNSVIENLLSNAIKFSRRNSEIIINCKKSEKFIEVSVKDFGIGIKKIDLDKLFKIDSHHSTAGTEEERGTGLGLILCREMIEKMGGVIKVESIENEGTTFSFTIPAVT